MADLAAVDADKSQRVGWNNSMAWQLQALSGLLDLIFQQFLCCRTWLQAEAVVEKVSSDMAHSATRRRCSVRQQRNCSNSTA